jgi:hypothetical protein
MTPDVQPAGIPADRPDPERPADPRPAWERIAYIWLAREVDAGQHINLGELARCRRHRPVRRGLRLRLRPRSGPRRRRVGVPAG